MSERVYRRWDDWILVTEFCVFEQLFFEGSSATKNSPKDPGHAIFDVLLMSRFQKFAASTAKKIKQF
jgi:hypothetical protein